MIEGLTSWPGRWTRLRNAWQTHQQSPEPSPQSTPSRHRPLWHPGFSLCHHSVPQWCIETDAEQRQKTGLDGFSLRIV